MLFLLISDFLLFSILCFLSVALAFGTFWTWMGLLFFLLVVWDCLTSVLLMFSFGPPFCLFFLWFLAFWWVVFGFGGVGCFWLFLVARC